jgi:hypothetical protein
MTFDEGRTRMPGNNGFSTMPVRPGMTFDIETLPVRPGMTFDIETLPDKQNAPGFDFLRFFIGQKQPNWGGSPGQEVPREAIEKMEQPGAKPPAGFFDDIRRKLGSPGVKEARSPSFDINQSQGALGRRSGEQLLRLQGGSGSMQNQQLQQELERRGIMSRGIQLPPV